MAKRGKRPIPSFLRLVEGTHREDRHGQASRPIVFEPLAMPKHLKAFAAEAWRKWIAPANWLDWSREPSAIAVCELWAEFRAEPKRFPASKHAQMRAYLNELGITDQRVRKSQSAVVNDDEGFA